MQNVERNQETEMEKWNNVWTQSTPVFKLLIGKYITWEAVDLTVKPANKC